MQMLADPDFELGTGWTYAGSASRVTTPTPYSGRYSGRLYARWRSSPPPTLVYSEISQELVVVPGVPVSMAFAFNLDGLPITPNVVFPTFSTLFVFWDAGGGAGYELAASFSKPEGFSPSGWVVAEVPLATPVGPSVALKFFLGTTELESPGGVYLIEGFCQIDAVELISSDEAHLVRSNALAFMDRLKGLIEAIDPNIGQVYVTTKRWPTVELLESEGTLRIDAAGLFDDTTRLGKDVTRFWWMRPRIECKPLTNGSGEYVTQVELIGFYQHEDGDGQFTALNHAAIEILDAVNTKEAEIVTLNTGDAYLGYLLERPRMEPIQHAQLESPKVAGNSVQITISFAEEVSYT